MLEKTQEESIQNKIREAIHPDDPYIGFDHTQYEKNVFGWEGDHAIFHEMIDEAKPSLIIEVGTWLGQSAINMGLHCRKRGFDTQIVCVDTWLGSLEFWGRLRGEEGRDLYLKHGYPNVYYHFLANVMHHGLQDIIIPFPVTSIIAAKWFAQKGIKANMIYIDGDHDEMAKDIELYYPLLTPEPNAVFLGHDYGWPGAKKAIEGYAKRNKLKVRTWGTEIREKQFWRMWR